MNTGASAQKIAHINVEELINQLDEKRAADETLKRFTDSLEQEGNCLIKEYQSVLNWISDADWKWTEDLNILFTKQLKDSQDRVRDFHDNWEAWIQERQNELMVPIRLKISAAIQLVGQQKNYLYVIDTSKTKTIVTPPEHDLTAAVKAYLQH
jgi:outer membrane protein